MSNEQETSKTIHNYDFNIIDIIKTGFKFTKGFKAIAWKLMIIYAIVAYSIYLICWLFLPSAELNSEQFQQNFKIIGFISIPILAPLMAGFDMTIINYLRGKDVSYKSIFNYYNIIWELSLASLSVHFINTVVSFIVNAIGIYLNLAWFNKLALILSITIAVIYMFTLPLIADKRLKIWDAMELSRKAVFAHFFKIIILYLFLILIMTVSAIPLGIGLIWTLPMILIVFYALLYRIMFDGVDYNNEEKIIAQ